MEFTHSPMSWFNDGVEPSDTIKNEGWLAGHKPPAAYFNFKWRQDYLSITELQNKLSTLDGTHTADQTATEAALSLKAPLSSPAFSGTPTAPTPASTSNNTELATTAFVKGIFNGIDFSSLQSHTLFVQNADLDTLRDDRAYICVGTMTNTPEPTTFCYVHAYDTSNTDRILQCCWVPDASNNIRSFVRCTDLQTWGNWTELATASQLNSQVERLEMLHEENRFRNQATLQAMNKAVQTLFIETYENLDSVNLTAGSGQTAIEAAYDSDLHIIKNTSGVLTLQTYASIVTGGRASAWVYIDSVAGTGGSVQAQISRDSGTTWTTIANNTIVSIDTQPAGVAVMLKVTLSGAITLKNIAWGVKD